MRSYSFLQPASRTLHRRDLHFILVGILSILLQTGCSSVVSRFVTRMVGQLSDPIDHVNHRVEKPLLPSVGLSILWVGHATMLIQIDDKVFLTDPVFTKTAGMLSKRLIEPGIDPSSIAKVDYVLISHIHLDHFSYGSLELLPKDGRLLIPLGGAAYTPEFGFAETLEMKPWDVIEHDGVRITALPVQHFGGRYGFDILWMKDRGYTGYVIEYHGKTVYFGGDTGYDPDLFKRIGEQFSIDVALLPIAPVEPRDFMQHNHVDPKEAVQIFEDLRAQIMIPMHHRTFFQGFDPDPTYAQRMLEKIVDEKGLQSRVRILDIGERTIIVQ